MKKRLLLILSVTLFVFILSVAVFAAEGKTVYVKSGALGNGTSESDAVGTLGRALVLLDGEGGTVVICGTVAAGKNFVVPEQSGDLVITSSGGGLMIDETLTFEKNTNNNLITVDTAIMGDGALFGGFNSLCFTGNVSMSGSVAFYGGVDAPAGVDTSTDTYSEELNASCITTLPYTITVDGGNFVSFEGGNRRALSKTLIGSIAARLDIVINGGTFGGSVSYAADDAVKNERAFSLSGMSILADDATLTINGGTFELPIYAQGYTGFMSTSASSGSQLTKSDRGYYAIDGDIAITINGGNINGCEINAFQNSSFHSQLLRGNYTLTVADGAKVKAGTVLDATQVKNYEGATDTKLATVTYPKKLDVTVKRFDVVNGVSKTYDEPLRIACIGDSITQGTGTSTLTTGITYSETRSYPARLLSLIHESGTDVILGNYGCAATKVRDKSGLYYNDMLAYTISTEECDADYVIIGLGTNDAAYSRYSEGQMVDFETRYRDLILDYAELPSTDMVFGTNALYRTSRAVSAVAVIGGIQEKVLNELAAEGKKCTFVDLYALTFDAAMAGTLLSGDNLHPDDGGYVIYAQAIYDAIIGGKCTLEDFESEDIYLSASGKNDASGTKDDPVSNIAIAFAKLKDGGTLHVIGEFEYADLDTYVPFTTPKNFTSLSIVGEGEGASLSINSKIFYINSDITFDNITISYSKSSSSAIYFVCGYNNVTFTDTFKTTGVSGAIIVCGFTVFSDVEDHNYYSPVAAISADRDCTITVKGGSYSYIIGGNLHWSSSYINAPYGIYSGDMVINVGEGVVLKNTASAMRYNGASAMNYLTGSVTYNLAAWNLASIREYTINGLASKYMAEFDESLNTGTVEINLAEGLDVEIKKTGDFDTDGDCDISDVMLMVKYMNSGMDEEKADNFYGWADAPKEITLLNVIRALKKVVA